MKRKSKQLALLQRTLLLRMGEVIQLPNMVLELRTEEML